MRVGLGPTPATANQVIYTENSSGSNIYQMTEGGSHPGTKLTAFSDLDNQFVNDLHWIPMDRVCSIRRSTRFAIVEYISV
jgi:hypothetical protein